MKQLTILKYLKQGLYIVFVKYMFVGNYVLNYLATQPKLPNFVIQALVTLFARISKLGWFDSDKEEFVFRNVVSDVAKFLQVCYILINATAIHIIQFHTYTLFYD